MEAHSARFHYSAGFPSKLASVSIFLPPSKTENPPFSVAAGDPFASYKDGNTRVGLLRAYQTYMLVTKWHQQGGALDWIHRMV